MVPDYGSACTYRSFDLLYNVMLGFLWLLTRATRHAGAPLNFIFCLSIRTLKYINNNIYGYYIIYPINIYPYICGIYIYIYMGI